LIKWINTIGYIKVYYSLNSSKSFKQEVFRYYKKAKKAIKILELFGIPTCLILDTLTDKRFYIRKLLGNTIFLKKPLISLLTKQILVRRLIKVFEINSNFSWIKLTCVLRSFLFLRKTNKKIYRVKYLKYLQFNLKQFWSLSYFKLLAILLENILFYIKKYCKPLVINNVWENNGLIFQHFSKNYYIYQLLTLVSIYYNCQLFSDFIGYHLKKDKKHTLSIRKIISCVEKFWRFYRFGFQGLQLRINGKINGKMRKSKYHYSLGKVPLQTLKILLNYSISVAYTRFGIITTKICVFYETKKI
jgi:hypothetical protein